VFCGDKSILNADYLIDDNGYNFDGFRGEGLLFDAPHNAHETRGRRVHSWQIFCCRVSFSLPFPRLAS
jgi:5'(3')-deoxyribonucleotidase